MHKLFSSQPYFVIDSRLRNAQCHRIEIRGETGRLSSAEETVTVGK